MPRFANLVFCLIFLFLENDFADLAFIGDLNNYIDFVEGRNQGGADGSVLSKDLSVLKSSKYFKQITESIDNFCCMPKFRISGKVHIYFHKFLQNVL